jgi:hypothetical protein
VILLLDTTVLGADPLCQSDAWQLIAHASPLWGVKVAITEVVQAEAVAGYKRRVSYAKAGLDKWADKYVGALGLTEANNAAGKALEAALDSYPTKLQERLNAAGVDVLPAPSVSHMELVERATQRRRPCDDKGDGYRDTLNWLALLDLVKADASERVIWVSDNSSDFGEGSESDELHFQLKEELEALGALDRVSWVRSLAEAVLALVTEYAPGSEADLKEATEQLRDASLFDYLRNNTVPELLSYKLSPRRCALPLGARSARVLAVGDSRELTLDLKGVVSDGPVVAEFSMEVDATIAVAETAEASGITVVSEESVEAPVIEKPLVLRGLLTLGLYGRPVSVQLASVEARTDDPGRAGWRIADLLTKASTARGFEAPTFSAGTLAALGRTTAPSTQLQKTIEAMNRAMGPGTELQKTLAALGRATGPSTQLQKTIEAMNRAMGPGTELRKTIEAMNRAMGPGTELRKTIEAMNRAMRSSGPVKHQASSSDPGGAADGSRDAVGGEGTDEEAAGGEEPGSDERDHP